MAYDIQPAPRVIKDLKKIKDKSLKEKYLEVIYQEIGQSPYQGKRKIGDLAGIWTQSFKYKGSDYRVAYRIIDDLVVPILLIGPRENFYASLKRQF